MKRKSQTYVEDGPAPNRARLITPGKIFRHRLLAKPNPCPQLVPAPLKPQYPSTPNNSQAPLNALIEMKTKRATGSLQI